MLDLPLATIKARCSGSTGPDGIVRLSRPRASVLAVGLAKACAVVMVSSGANRKQAPVPHSAEKRGVSGTLLGQ